MMVSTSQIPANAKNDFTSFLKSLASFSGDLSSLSCPTFFLAPVSLIEYNENWAAQPELFAAIPETPSEKERLLAVVKWYISYLNAAFKRRIPQGQIDKKPFNPILGEQWKMSWMHDQHTTQVICEQVCHHPPITAFHVEDKKAGIRLDGHTGQTSRMAGTTLVCEQFGCGLLDLKDLGEKYLLSNPSLTVRGIWYAAPFIELLGTAYIQSSTGYYAHFEFSSRGWISGEKNHFKCLINHNERKTNQWLYKIEGQWTGQSILFDFENKQSSPFLDVESLQQATHILPPLDQMGPLESRRVWSKVAEAIHLQNASMAKKEKYQVEEQQRAEMHQREKLGVDWQPELFRWVEQESCITQLQDMWMDEIGC
ncbi:Protein kes1 [Choanephora cucurbitarum]|uniref:Protein kes1 n=1 Tax=Choanephora cucurbitarum TaxID=101091 RepID=A0A1C7N6A7_9FUNG|nr:Protein kes1 [Choanephora cucurbitarum]